MSEGGPMSERQSGPEEQPPLHLADVRERSRYEATLGDDPRVAGWLSYQLSGEWIALIHTEIDPDFEGQGVGGRLVRSVLDDARRRGLKVIPKCAFVVGWLHKHPDQHDVLFRPLEPLTDMSPSIRRAP